MINTFLCAYGGRVDVCMNLSHYQETEARAIVKRNDSVRYRPTRDPTRAGESSFLIEEARSPWRVARIFIPVSTLGLANV